jgi:uncharacterized coiled-coil DUF342 family protein
MAHPLDTDNINEIIKSAMRQNMACIRAQIDGVKIEMKVIREEVRKVSWEIEAIKERFTAVEG